LELDERVIEKHLQNEINTALMKGGYIASIIAFSSAMLLIILYIFLQQTPMLLSCGFAFLMGLLCMVVHKYAKVGNIAGWGHYYIMLAMTLLPSIFLLAIVLSSKEAGVVEIITGPTTFSYFIVIAVTGFIFDPRLSYSAGLIAGLGYFLVYLIARTRLMSLGMADSGFMVHLTAPPLYVFKSLMMICVGLLTGTISHISKRFILRVLKEEQEKYFITQTFIHELLETQKETVHRLVRASEFRDTDTGSHIRRMSHYCSLLAREYGLTDEECNLLLYAAPMHDVGKIGIPDAILLKQGKLDAEEYRIIKTHSRIGDEILSGSKSNLLEMARIIALTHHEKWDGTGYPGGLKEEEIPIVGRITCLCDAFDALTSDRPYKKAWPVEDAMKEIEAKGGKDFDPALVELFRKSLPEIMKIRESLIEVPHPGTRPE
jgi:hypothetical protein